MQESNAEGTICWLISNICLIHNMWSIILYYPVSYKISRV